MSAYFFPAATLLVVLIASIVVFSILNDED